MKLKLTLVALVAALLVAGSSVTAWTAARATPETALMTTVFAAGVALILGVRLLGPRAREGDLEFAGLGLFASGALGFGLSRLDLFGSAALSAYLPLAFAFVAWGRIELRKRIDVERASPEDLVAFGLASEAGLSQVASALEARGQPALPAVLTACGSQRGQARLRAVRILGLVGDSGDGKSVPRVVALLHERETATVAAQAARRLAHPDLIAPLQALKESPDVWLARAACGDLDLLAPLLAGEVSVEEDVARLLGAGLVPALGAWLEAGPRPEADLVRALRLLAATGTADSEAYALAASRAGEGIPPRVRAAALEALAELNPVQALGLGRQALEAADPSVQRWGRALVERAEAEA